MIDRYELVIEADYNDGDYVTKMSDVSLEFIETLAPLVEAIKSCNEWYNWPSNEHIEETPKGLYPNIDPELIEAFGDCVPYIEGGVHSITSIVYYPMPTKTVLM